MRNKFRPTSSGATRVMDGTHSTATVRRSRGPRPHPLILTVAAAIALLPIVAAPAHAAAPSNDRPAYAKKATGIGYTDSVDVSQATSGRLDPTNCSNNASVWYKFTAAATETINVNTNGSNYDTVIGVYTGKPGAFTKVKCVNWGITRQAALDFKATAGTTYYFMVAVCCGNGQDGQDFKKQPLLLKFNMQTPLRVTKLTAADAGTVDQADADAHVTLSHQCNYAADYGEVYAQLRQRVGGTFVAKGDTWNEVKCGLTSVDLALTFEPWGDVAFSEGPATLSVWMYVCAHETGTCRTRQITEEVTLAFP